jgi:hypothetical protein
MTTTITINGISYTIPNDKVQNVISLLEAYKVTQTPRGQVREVLTSNPIANGKILING